MQNLEAPETLSYNEVIAQGQSNLFDFDYPIFNEEYRTTLQTNICKAYYTSEICCDAVERFKLWLDVRMNTIMPYYNRLYQIEWDSINPLTDYMEDETYSSNRQQTGSGNTEQEDASYGTTNTSLETDGESSALTKNSSTPQGMLSNLEYYDGATDNSQSASTTETGTNMSNASYSSSRDNSYNETNKEDIARHRQGYHQNPGKLIQDYKAGLMKIDQMIIDELADLFFGILSVG